MKIAITDLKDYNEGILRFEWVDLDECSTAEEISDFIDEFLDKRSKETRGLHEEWFVTDYEEFVDLGEYPNLDEIEKAVKLSKEYTWEIVSSYYSFYHSFDDLEETYNGTYKSEEEFAEEIANEIYSEKELGPLSPYIDWERYANDLFINDYISEKLENGEVAVFRRL